MAKYTHSKRYSDAELKQMAIRYKEAKRNPFDMEKVFHLQMNLSITTGMSVEQIERNIDMFANLPD